MKKILLLFLVIIASSFILTSCSSDDGEESDSDNGYNYTIQKVFHPKISFEASVSSNRALISRQFSYTIDTLELSMTNRVNLLFQIDFEAFATITQPSNEIVHVNYLKLIDIDPNPQAPANPVMTIYLSNKVFTYSSSNLNLTNIYPDLFIKNPTVPTIITPEKIPLNIKHPNYIRAHSSSNLYEIGDEIFISNDKYVVLSVD